MPTYSLHSVNAYSFYIFVIVVAIGILEPNLVPYIILRLQLIRIQTAMFFMKMRFKWFFFRQRFK